MKLLVDGLSNHSGAPLTHTHNGPGGGTKVQIAEWSSGAKGAGQVQWAGPTAGWGLPARLM